MSDSKKKTGGLADVVAGESAIATVGKEGAGLTYRGYDIYDLAAHPESATLELNIIALVLQFSETTQYFSLVSNITTIKVQNHIQIRSGVSQTINCRYCAHDNRIIALK